MKRVHAPRSASSSFLKATDDGKGHEVDVEFLESAGKPFAHVGGKLLINYSTGALGCELRPASIDRYYCTDKDVDLLLERDSRNAITQLQEQHPDHRIVRRKVK